MNAASPSPLGMQLGWRTLLAGCGRTGSGSPSWRPGASDARGALLAGPRAVRLVEPAQQTGEKGVTLRVGSSEVAQPKCARRSDRQGPASADRSREKNPTSP